MKSVLMSIRPKWCNLIASGKKTIEVRKTKPIIETPFKCYIYCTHDNSKNALHLYVNSGYGRKEIGVIGNWRSGKDVVDVNPHLPAYRYNAYLAEGKVIGEFVCDDVDIYSYDYCDGVDIDDDSLLCTMLERDEINYYAKGKTSYGWHISDLKIYDKPKKLSEFSVADKKAIRQCKSRSQNYYAFTDTGYIKNGFICTEKYDWCIGCKMKALTRPPQSWCYVEEIES